MFQTIPQLGRTMEVIQEVRLEAAPPSLSKGKKISFTIASLVIVLGIMCCLGEVALLFLPLGEYRSAPFRQYDSQLGQSLIPNRHLIHSRGCFQGEVSINSWGMRDRERTLAKPPGEFRIAIIGGAEAAQVKPQEVLNIRMEELLRGKGYRNVEVLNFSVEGTGTTQESLMYEQKVRQFHPDLVLLMFTDNDVLKNSSTLQPKVYGIHDWYSPYYNLSEDGQLVLQPVERRSFNGLRSFLEADSLLVYYLERTWLQFDIPSYKWQGLPLFYGTFSDDPLNPEWKQAWLVTEKVLQKINDSVTADGAKFLVLPWPSPTSIDPDWRQTMMARFGQVPSAFNPDKPQERLKQLAERSHVPIAFFTSYMQTYRDEHHLQAPYFCFPCDAHYNALGYQVSAEAIVQKLADLNMLPPASSE